MDDYNSSEHLVFIAKYAFYTLCPIHFVTLIGQWESIVIWAPPDPMVFVSSFLSFACPKDSFHEGWFVSHKKSEILYDNICEIVCASAP